MPAWSIAARMPFANEHERFDFAKNLIIEAGDLALQYFASVNELAIMSKGAQDMVSEADIAVEKLIRSRLMAEYPGDGYLGEETGHAAGSGDSGIWVVDPIDGTQPFLSGLNTWCISIAYVRSNEVLLGMVNNPAAGELFIGGAGRTAELNGQPIAPRPDASVGDGLTYLGCNPRLRPEQVVPVLDRLLRAGGMFVRNGSGIGAMRRRMRPSCRLCGGAHQLLGLPRWHRDMQVGRCPRERLPHR